METKAEYKECTDCRCFVWCESCKQYFHKATKIPCEDFIEKCVDEAEISIEKCEREI